MHDTLRTRVLRKLEGLPEDQLYQVLDFIEFLEEKYGSQEPVELSGLQRFAERLEDRLRRRTVSPGTVREAFQLIAVADRVLSGVSDAGRKLLDDVQEEDRPSPHEGDHGEGGGRDPGDSESGLTPESAPRYPSP